MKYSVAAIVAATAIGVSAQTPAGCTTQGTGKYELTIVKPAVAAKRSLEKRAQCGGGGTLLMELNGGVLTDAKGRIGSIVANRQFQFDGPPAQAGAIYKDGWSICNNGSLAIAGSTIFYQCKSGGEPYNAADFYNLYDKPEGAGCVEVRMNTIPCTEGAGSGASQAPVSQATDGQATAAPATIVTQSPDGQPTAAPATTVAPSSAVTQISDGQVQASSAGVVTQISDGQPQATAASNATITQAAPTAIATGAAANFAASGAVVVIGAFAAFFL